MRCIESEGEVERIPDLGLQSSPVEELLPAVDVIDAPVSAVLLMMWTASTVTSIGVTTRRIGSLARS